MMRLGFRWLERGSCRHPQAMTIKGGSLCAVDFPALVGVIDHPQRGLFLFDTGYDRAFIEATRPFPERFYRWMTPVSIGADADWRTWLAVNAIDESRIAGTIVSHFHGDHVAGMRHLSHLPVYCARAGLTRLRRAGRIGRVRQGLLSALVPPSVDAKARFFEDAASVALPSAFAPFSEGRDILGDGSLIAVELPGHCPGHWGLALRTEADRHILLAADAVWSNASIAEGRPPPRLTTGLLGDTKGYRATLARLTAAHERNRDLLILPSHCAASASLVEDTDAR